MKQKSNVRQGRGIFLGLNIDINITGRRKNLKENKTRLKIRLITLSDIKKFVEIVSSFDEKTELENSDGSYRVSAKSFIGAIAAIEDWDDIWVVSENPNLYSSIREFII